MCVSWYLIVVIAYSYHLTLFEYLLFQTEIL